MTARSGTGHVPVGFPPLSTHAGQADVARAGRGLAPGGLPPSRADGATSGSAIRPRYGPGTDWTTGSNLAGRCRSRPKKPSRHGGRHSGIHRMKGIRRNSVVPGPPAMGTVCRGVASAFRRRPRRGLRARIRSATPARQGRFTPVKRRFRPVVRIRVRPGAETDARLRGGRKRRESFVNSRARLLGTHLRSGTVEALSFPMARLSGSSRTGDLGPANRRFRRHGL